MISAAVAVLLCTFFLWSYYRSVEAGIEDRGWDVVVMGDSIIGKGRGDGSVDEYFEKYSGMTMVNGAFGGNCASVGEHADRYSYHEESINLYNLAKAACYRDFGVQWADLAASQTKVAYFEEALSELSAADLNQTRILLLAFGTNDYTTGRELDDPDDPYNVKTYGGALRYAVELFQETYPDLKVVLVTPLFCHLSERENCFGEDFGGGTLDQYAEKEKEIAAEYGLDVIDVLEDVGINETNYEDYLEDGMHLNEAGRELYARFLAEKIRQLSEEKSE